jgi:hypothetical protein
MISIKDQFDNVLFGHFGELPCEDILQIEQVFEALSLAVVLDDPEGDLMILLLTFGGIISSSKAEADNLGMRIEVLIHACRRSYLWILYYLLLT